MVTLATHFRSHHGINYHHIRILLDTIIMANGNITFDGRLTFNDHLAKFIADI